jgi:magnesium chelatase family protein
VALAGIAELPKLTADDWPPRPTPARLLLDPPEGGPDLADLRGLRELRRALEVAAAGAHGLLMAGPPGAGMSLAAGRIPSVLPPMSESEALEVARVASAAGRVSDGQLPAGRPFRAPHHTISEAGLLGGGIPPRPGEITLAHGGVLFLDEVDEFGRGTVEALRAPLRHGEVLVARGGEGTRLPSSFLLVAAINLPSPAHGPDDDRLGSARSEMDRLAARMHIVSDAATSPAGPSR